MEREQRLAGYRIEREIARSSIASIYEAYQESLDRKVLLKRLHPQLAGDAEIRTRFEREARALARIKHKNIVHIYDFRADQDLVMIASEWIAGGTLAQYMEQHPPLDEREAIALAIDVLEGLAVAHQAGIIHRDIKPSNLLIASTGAIKITDFGLAQFEGSPALTQQGAAMGTPAYLAPELLSGATATARSDLYNFGVTLYELLAGDNPFRAETLSETLSRLSSVRLEPLEGVSDEFNRILLSLVDKRIDKRPEDAATALALLRPLAARHGVERGWTTLHSADNETEQGRRTIRPRRPRRPSRSVVAAAWALMFLSLLLTWWGTRPSPAGLAEAPPERDSLSAELSQSPARLSDEPNEQSDTLASGALEGTGEAAEPEKPAASQEQQARDDAPDEELTPPGAVQGDESTASRGAATIEPPALDVADATVQEDQQPVTGHVYFTVHPWANIYHEDRFLALTPYTRPVELPAGRQTLTLLNPKFPPLNWDLDVPRGDTSQVHINLFHLVGTISFINATPWAEVYIDEEYVGRTPIGGTQYLTPGQHTLQFRHPEYGSRSLNIHIFAGQDPHRYVVDLTRPD